MSADVVDLEKYRQRRHWRNLSKSIRTGIDWPEPTVASPAAHLELEGYRPTHVIVDETPWLTVDDIARRVDAGLADASPMRRAFLNATASSDPEAMRRVLLDAKAALDAASTLPGIRPGSDDGDAEGQPRDPEVPRS